MINKTHQRLLAVALPLCLSVTACQSVPIPHSTTAQAQQPHRLDSFDIYGKFGFVNADRSQSGSAFYQWKQKQERFAMQLEGALGIGATNIQYNGSQAQLTNATIGTITAKTPEELLIKATPFQAPISQLPYWISGSPAPSDVNDTWDDQKRLATATNGNWTAQFSYANDAKLPKKIVARHKDKTKVVLTIKHN